MNAVGGFFSTAEPPDVQSLDVDRRNLAERIAAGVELLSREPELIEQQIGADVGAGVAARVNLGMGENEQGLAAHGAARVLQRGLDERDLQVG
jgi:hypothetical protein